MLGRGIAPEMDETTRATAERHFREGYEAQVRGDLDAAFTHYRQSIAAVPTAEAHTFLGWALSFQGRTVHLFFVLPVSSRGLLLFVIGMNVLMVIAGALNLAGHVALFAGMGAGWLLGGGTPSPARRFLLKVKLAQLKAEERRVADERRQRVKKSNLRVIHGGRDDEAESTPDEDRGPDGKWLN